MPDDYDALEAQAVDEPAFSNSDEGYAWIDANCAICVHELPPRERRDGDGCPLILIALLGKRPRQWSDGPRTPEGRYAMATQYVCSEQRDEPAADELRPVPVMAGQGELLPCESAAPRRPVRDGGSS
ncbi:hypothetical protein B4N89_27515 [Embleya scabrispora]|uniref:Uncharacterized protein n=2 Tax=Embleya scabrispora TaxID=159449 RepID=A0A1T3P518_9ACTN|nr:hypothetical protein B4N89_27515 [Embleya scabrispora]